MTDQEITEAFDTFWEQDARNDRDEWDQHLRHVEDERMRGEATSPNETRPATEGSLPA